MQNNGFKKRTKLSSDTNVGIIKEKNQAVHVVKWEV